MSGRRQPTRPVLLRRPGGRHHGASNRYRHLSFSGEAPLRARRDSASGTRALSDERGPATSPARICMEPVCGMDSNTISHVDSTLTPSQLRSHRWERVVTAIESIVLTPLWTAGDGSRATVGQVRIRRKEIQPPRPAARRCTRLPPRLRSRKACSLDVPQTYGDGDAYCMRARQYCALRLTVPAQCVSVLLPSKRFQA